MVPSARPYLSFGKFISLPILVALVAAGYRFYTLYNTPCNMDPPIEFYYKTTSPRRQQNDDERTSSEGGIRYSWEDPCQVFSTEYYEAREKFRRAVSKYKVDGPAGGGVEILSLPIALESDGSDVLTIDVAIFPGNLPGTIVHSSGLHGVEGYAGSAIQIALLQEGVLPLSSDDANHRPTIVFFHALNPVGMKEHRRCNENNVDLNRNFFDDFSTFLKERDPNVANYEDFRSFLSPTTTTTTGALSSTGSALVLGGYAPTAWYATVGIWIRLLPELVRHGFVQLKTAMVSGQYHHPEGIFYGGTELQMSARRLVDFLDSRPDLFAQSESVIWIDVHTGLGPFGKDSLHCEQSGGGKPLSGSELHRDWFPTSHGVVTSFADVAPASDGAFTGYGMSSGTMTTYLGIAYEERRRGRKHGSDLGSATSTQPTTTSRAQGLFIVQEFGTLPGILVGRALILDNMLYQNERAKREPGEREDHLSPGGAVGDDEKFSYRSPWLRNAFYPQSTSWRASVVKRGVALMLQAIEYNDFVNSG